jgi:hypothetical protein
LRGQVNASFRQPTAGQLEGRVLAQSVKIIRIRVAASNGEHTRAQNIGYRMGDQVRIAVVGDERGKGVDQAKTLVGARQQQDATIGTDLAGVEGGGDFLLADTWQRKREKGIVSVGGHGRFCPGGESGVSTQSLRDSRHLYHARQRIPAMR